ncbi:MAG: aminotransferase class I/II-fold pyridoxal phosphate-dependent enzyme [Planctomycetota bacterium]|jgi:histidinol-phosphate/aromatic aminotransferase/cobyric acid decarboxylase-like protein/choline kinase|nr:aminotransferase class I/II-fold pyridoxal phosphate-dependent enzyme [Planctomycetota bacterium]
MQAVFLAAGMGKRLRHATSDRPKCMVEVNGIPLLQRALSILSLRPLSRFVIVVGFRGDMVRSAFGGEYNGVPIEYVENSRYDETNNIYSLFLARRHLAEEDAILLESDVIFDKTVTDRIFENENPNLVVVDKYQPFMDGTVIKISADNEVTAVVPKSHFDSAEVGSYYKTVNIYKFSREFSEKTYTPFLEAYCSAMGENRFYEHVLRVILALEQNNIKALVLDGEKWLEIDTLPDLENARMLFADAPDKKLDLFEKRYGGFWTFENLRDHCYLSNPFFRPERLLEEYRLSLPTLVANYPSGQETQGRLAGELLSCREEWLAVANGASEIIVVLGDLLKGRIGVMFPTFMEYPARIGRKRIVPLYPRSDKLRYGADDLIEAENTVDSLLLVNPDNPSGNFMPRKEALSVVAHYGARGKAVVVDESFVDFAGKPGANGLIGDSILGGYPNLVVIRSLSKTFGVPGLRLGVAASGDMEVVKRLRRSLAIWNINSFAEFFLQVGIKYRRQYLAACRQLIDARESMRRALAELEFVDPLPSQANFILCELTGNASARSVAARLLFEDDIFIKRISPNRRGLEGKKYIRVAVTTPDDNAFLVERLAACLAGECAT